MKLEQTILKNLIYNEEYLRKVLPFLKSEYFTDRSDKTLYDEIASFTETYNSTPTVEALVLAVKERRNLTDDEVEKCETYLQEIAKTKDEESKVQWLTDKTEQFCQEKAIYNAVLGAISILDGKDKTQDKGAIPKVLSDALAVSFDNSVGHDYLENSEERYEFYHRKEERIPFDLDFFNKITKGGLPTKTLNIALAGTGVGKSLFMCHVAAGCMVQGKNVLYITLEMAEEKIAERIDANLLNVTVDDLVNLPKEMYDKKIAKLREKTVGKLIIKEYPTASASTTHFRTLLNELNLKSLLFLILSLLIILTFVAVLELKLVLTSTVTPMLRLLPKSCVDLQLNTEYQLYLQHKQQEVVLLHPTQDLRTQVRVLVCQQPQT